jgi:hypothetical protein
MLINRRQALNGRQKMNAEHVSPLVAQPDGAEVNRTNKLNSEDGFPATKITFCSTSIKLSTAIAIVVSRMGLRDEVDIVGGETPSS